VADLIQGESPGGRRPELLLGDLSSRADVRRAAEEFLAAAPLLPLHLLVNNAGLVSLHRRETPDGLEQVFAVNYLAHYQLTALLLPRLLRTGTPGAPARVVNVSSDMHRLYRLKPLDLQSRRRYSWHAAYGRSKLALLYFTRELARRLGSPAPAGDARVTVNAVDPGPVRSGIARHSPPYIARPTAWMMRWLFPEASKAARTALWIATAPEVAPITGGYFRFGRLRRPRLDADPVVARQLWDRSAELAEVTWTLDRSDGDHQEGSSSRVGSSRNVPSGGGASNRLCSPPTISSARSSACSSSCPGCGP
jgi:NAD(P)-dependent dehydrogenase (short-subunit alcohol dehydrogenase family)